MIILLRMIDERNAQRRNARGTEDGILLRHRNPFFLKGIREGREGGGKDRKRGGGWKSGVGGGD